MQLICCFNEIHTANFPLSLSTIIQNFKQVSQSTTGARDEETKKGKERNLQWQTGCSPRPPRLTQRYVVLHAGWSSGGSSKFQISSKLVEWFSRCGVEICHFLYLRPVAYTRDCRDYATNIVHRIS